MCPGTWTLPWDEALTRQSGLAIVLQQLIIPPSVADIQPDPHLQQNWQSASSLGHPNVHHWVKYNCLWGKGPCLKGHLVTQNLSWLAQAHGCNYVRGWHPQSCLKNERLILIDYHWLIRSELTWTPVFFTLVSQKFELSEFQNDTYCQGFLCSALPVDNIWLYLYLNDSAKIKAISLICETLKTYFCKEQWV